MSLPNPLRPEKSKLLRWLFPKGTGTFGRNREDYDPTAVERTLEWLRPVFGPHSYFRLEVQGLELVPNEPVMLVSNHSGGTTIPDVWGFLVGWYRYFGVQRPVHPMAHELILSTGPTRRFFGARGVVDANPQMAERIISDWQRDLLVMPGGDLDTWRPHRDRYKVRFAGRKGYARLAKRLGVRIVPVANDGAHDTFFVLTDGQRLASRFRLNHLFRARIFPVHVSLPWGLAVGPWPHIPLPAKLRYRIGGPIDPSRFEDVDALDEVVRDAVQTQLDALASSRQS